MRYRKRRNCLHITAQIDIHRIKLSTIAIDLKIVDGLLEYLRVLEILVLLHSFHKGLIALSEVFQIPPDCIFHIFHLLGRLGIIRSPHCMYEAFCLCTHQIR